ncbi:MULTISPECIES: SusC/RagA family TonB-linked outer membrane protein [Flavobacteriaceae]|uniref:SusC/RagA family TonB-linked outer membrane protein n=1 Tax=Flavobacteriaceae TaxID=49546 RepID=UPI001490FE6B|nr:MULTISPECIES: SusC/RagA family TonB-linked outer membrane protein [Allomuricauda]MDC6367312.1 SusC/RagA family TonB-linked outer membrane protein [Muricauda sp. AC10]
MKEFFNSLKIKPLKKGVDSSIGICIALLFFCISFLPSWANEGNRTSLVNSETAIYNQQLTVTGIVLDETGSPLPGASIVEIGTTNGAVTDFDGDFSITLGNKTARLLISYIGYEAQELLPDFDNPMNISLVPSSQQLDEVVIIGYGSTTKKDATGAVVGVTEEELNQGFIASPQDLLVGKAAGVNITTAGGAPGSGSEIKIRGGASLDASNTPLIIIDDVPLDNANNPGSRNIFDFINPSDISSFTVLKDASATAIYGSRASNGVIIITTKKGISGELKFNFGTSMSVSALTDKIDVLNADQFRSVIAQRLPGRVAELGNYNTDWQDQIFKGALGTDTNFSVRGGLFGIPFRASIGYTQQDGILKTEALQRTTASFNLSPKLFDEKLRIQLNARGSYIENNFADTGAIFNAIQFDPTQPVFDPTLPEGYFDYYESNGVPTSNTAVNPLALLTLRDNSSNLRRLVANAKLDYQLHFFPDVTATLNLGIDKSDTNGVDNQPGTISTQALTDGRFTNYSQDEENTLLDFYVKYSKELEKLKLRFDVTAGYSYQNFNDRQNFDQVRGDGVGGTIVTNTILENNLQSYFGRANLILSNNYLFTFTYRRDGSSRFGGDNRWGNFPAAAFAWNVSDENFMENSKWFSNLKLRFGWGITGQQDVIQGNNTQPYLPQFSPSFNGASIQVGQDDNGNPIFSSTLRAEPYDVNIKWEETTTYNLGVDFGLFDNVLSGSVELYQRDTEDLLSTVNIPSGSNLSNRLPTNIGSLSNKGVEVTLNAKVFDTESFSWDLGFNYAYNENEVEELFLSSNDPGTGIAVPGTVLVGFGGDDGAQYHLIGEPTRSYLVYVQAYNSQGNPIPGTVVDLNGDGRINFLDRRPYRQAAPLVNLGLNSRFNWKKWDMSFSMRANIGNYNYNGVEVQNGTFANVNIGQDLRNVTLATLTNGFANYIDEITFSDYFVQDASFVRLDNVSLGYTFNDIFSEQSRLRLYSTLQNVFVITDYEGLDPEVTNGIDRNIFPRPFIAQLGLSIDF